MCVIENSQYSYLIPITIKNCPFCSPTQ